MTGGPTHLAQASRFQLNFGAALLHDCCMISTAVVVSANQVYCVGGCLLPLWVSYPLQPTNPAADGLRAFRVCDTQQPANQL